MATYDIIEPTPKQVLSAIRAEIEKRESMRKMPLHILTTELMNMFPRSKWSHLSNALNQLYIDGLIGTGRTISGRYITLAP